MGNRRVISTFNIVPEMTGANQMESLLGTSFSMSMTASDEPAHASYTEAGSEGDSRDWCLCSPVSHATLRTQQFSFSNGNPAVISITDNYDRRQRPARSRQLRQHCVVFHMIEPATIALLPGGLVLLFAGRRRFTK